MDRGSVVAVFTCLIAAMSCSSSDNPAVATVAAPVTTTTPNPPSTPQTSAAVAVSASTTDPDLAVKPTVVTLATPVPTTMPPSSTTTVSNPPPTAAETATTLPGPPCPLIGDEAWFDVREASGDPDGDSVLDKIVTASRIAPDWQQIQGREYELCIELSSGGTRRAEFHSILGEGGTRPVGSINVGDIGDTIFVAHDRGASVLILAEYAIINGALSEITFSDADTQIMVGGGAQHARGVTCVGPASDGRYGFVVRNADAVHPIPADYDAVTFDRSAVAYRRSGNRFVVVDSRTDQIRYDGWPDAFAWWQLVGCPGIDPILG